MSILSQTKILHLIRFQVSIKPSWSCVGYMTWATCNRDVGRGFEMCCFLDAQIYLYCAYFETPVVLKSKEKLYTTGIRW